jgi:hypothetical protein
VSSRCAIAIMVRSANAERRIACMRRSVEASTL